MINRLHVQALSVNSIFFKLVKYTLFFMSYGLEITVRSYMQSAEHTHHQMLCLSIAISISNSVERVTTFVDFNLENRHRQTPATH